MKTTTRYKTYQIKSINDSEKTSLYTQPRIIDCKAKTLTVYETYKIETTNDSKRSNENEQVAIPLR